MEPEISSFERVESSDPYSPRMPTISKDSPSTDNDLSHLDLSFTSSLTAEHEDGGIAGSEVPAFAPSYMNIQNHAPQTMTVPIVDRQNHQDRIQYLLEKLEEQGIAIAELFQFSRKAHSTLHNLTARVEQLEAGIDTRSDQNDHELASHLAELDRDFMGIGTHVSQIGHTVTNSNALATIRSTPGQKITSRDLSNAMIDIHNSTTSAQTSTHLITSKASKRLVVDDVKAGKTTKAGVAKQSKKLKLKIPSNVTGQVSSIGVASPFDSAPQTPPLSAFGTSFPTSPLTPYRNGQIGPPESYKKTTTAINKRGIHNCDKSVPPGNVQLPKIPLTDLEIIVFFFNCLSKPLVSLRLYAREWGPASIVQVLNDHRLIEPPYLRNTCSVKCTTAMKNGRKIFGNNWEDDFRAAFATADDGRATDLIRPEGEETVDYYVRALSTNLKGFPTDDTGIFTRCVKYCIENNAPYTMSNVHLLAVDIQNGTIPQHPASPAPGDVVTPTHLRSEAPDGEGTGNYFGKDEGMDTLSPAADKTSHSNGKGTYGSFTTLNTPQE